MKAQLERGHLNGGRGLPYLELAKMHEATGDDENALSCINEMITSCHTIDIYGGSSLYFQRALINYRNENYKDALKDLDKAMNTKEVLYNEHHEAKRIFWERAKNNEKLRDYQSAINDLHEIIELNLRSGELTNEDVSNLKNCVKYFEKIHINL